MSSARNNFTFAVLHRRDPLAERNYEGCICIKSICFSFINAVETINEDITSEKFLPLDRFTFRTLVLELRYSGKKVDLEFGVRDFVSFSVVESSL